MPEQSDANTGGDAPPDETFSPLVKAYIDQKIEESQEAQDRTRKKKWKNSWRSASPITKGTFVITAAVAVATISYSIIAGLQLRAMHHTNELTQAALDKASQASAESSRQFQVQLSHFDAGLGRTGLLAQHSGEQAIAATNAATASRSAADTASRQLELAQKQFETSQRPWIEITSKKIDTFVWRPNHGGLTLVVNVGYRNVGNLPAVDIHMAQKAFIVNATITADFLTYLKTKQRETCTEDIEKTFQNGWGAAPVVFPNIVPSTYGFTEGTDSPTQKQTSTSNTVWPFIVGCIYYRFTDSPTVHQTGFIWDITRSVPKDGSRIPFVPVWQNIPVDEVLLTDGYSGNAYNN